MNLRLYIPLLIWIAFRSRFEESAKWNCVKVWAENEAFVGARHCSHHFVQFDTNRVLLVDHIADIEQNVSFANAIHVVKMVHTARRTLAFDLDSNGLLLYDGSEMTISTRVMQHLDFVHVPHSEHIDYYVFLCQNFSMISNSSTELDIEFEKDFRKSIVSLDEFYVDVSIRVPNFLFGVWFLFVRHNKEHTSFSLLFHICFDSVQLLHKHFYRCKLFIVFVNIVIELLFTCLCRRHPVYWCRSKTASANTDN